MDSALGSCAGAPLTGVQLAMEEGAAQRGWMFLQLYRRCREQLLPLPLFRLDPFLALRKEVRMPLSFV